MLARFQMFTELVWNTYEFIIFYFSTTWCFYQSVTVNQTHAFASEVFQEFHCQVIQAWIKAEESRKPEAVFGNYLSSDSR